MSFPGLSEQLAEINREIRHREMVLDATDKIGCSGLPTIAQMRDELAELKTLRENLESLRGRVK